MIYDLEPRTEKFAIEVIKLCKKIYITPINKRIIEQVIASSGSIGANYNEANEAESKKDFYHKIQISKKEIKETQHWLRLLAEAEEKHKNEISILWKEAHELVLIFSKILSKRNSVQ